MTNMNLMSYLPQTVDEFVFSVIPAKAGTQCSIRLDAGQDQQLDPGLRRDDRCDERNSDESSGNLRQATNQDNIANMAILYILATIKEDAHDLRDLR